MRTTRRLIAPAAILVLGAACATADSPWSGPFGSEATATGKVATVEVENNNLADMRIYAIRDGSRQWLGRVPSFTTRTFRLPAGWLDTAPEIRLLADATASSPDFRSEPFRVRGGQVVEFRIGDPIAFSRVAIWDGR